MSNAVATQYTPLIGHSISELESFAESFDEKPFRGRQLFDWIYRQQVDDFSKMTDLSKTFRERLNKVSVHPLKLLNREESLSKKTKKFLFEVSGGKMIESVLMKEGNRTTVCLSTQVGCAVDCDFCATGKMGFVKNLTAGEIVDQFLQLQKISDQKITNVVFMGMGEPFLNYKNSIAAADLLHHPSGINMAAWRVTISTAGVVHKIKQFADERHPYKLAVSLNGSTQNQRLKTMPITKTHSFSDLIKTSKDYAYHSRNRVTFEYVLLDGINDDPKDAEKLNRLLNSINCKLNVIPYNEIGGPYRRPSDLRIKTFLHPLKKASFPVQFDGARGRILMQGVDN